MRIWSFVLFLFFVAAPLHAEIVKLSCEDGDPANTTLVEVNYENQLVIWGTPEGGLHWIGPVKATVTDNEIRWVGVGKAQGIDYRVDRISGEFEACEKGKCWPTSTCQKTDAPQP